MRTVSSGYNLHEMSNPVSGKNKKNIINLSFAKLAQRVVKINKTDLFFRLSIWRLNMLGKYFQKTTFYYVFLIVPEYIIWPFMRIVFSLYIDIYIFFLKTTFGILCKLSTMETIRTKF